MHFDSEDARQEYNELLRVVSDTGPTAEEVADAVRHCGLTDGIPAVYGPAADDRRRERYVAAINSALPHEPLDSDICRAADAAMAVADAEQRGQREDLESAEAEIREQDAELARLHEDNKATRASEEMLQQQINAQAAEIDRLRAELDSINAVLVGAGNEYPLSARGVRDVVSQREGHRERAEDAEATLERLRAELEAARAGAELWADAQRRDAYARIAAEAIIERVRAVLDSADLNDRESGHHMDIRDALNGDSE